MREQTDRVIILITGIPGSGKSSLGRRISSSFKLPYIDYDTVCQPFLTEIWHRQPNKVPYAQFCLDWRDASYGTFWNPVLENIALGNNVVASAPLSKDRADPRFFQNLKKQTANGFTVLNIHLDADKEYLKQRLIERGESRDLEKIQKWDEFHNLHQRIPLKWDADRIISITIDNDVFSFEIVEPMIQEYFSS